MRGLLLLPIFLGAAAVLQGTYNARIAETVGLANAVLLNGMVVLALSVLCWALVRTQPAAFPASFALKGGWGDLRAWFPLVGLLGFGFVLGLPYAFEKLGAFRVVMLLIGSQLAAGLLWDRFAAGLPLTPTKVAGAILAMAGAWLVNRS